MGGSTLHWVRPVELLFGGGRTIEGNGRVGHIEPHFTVGENGLGAITGNVITEHSLLLEDRNYLPATHLLETRHAQRVSFCDGRGNIVGYNKGGRGVLWLASTKTSGKKQKQELFQ